MKMQQLLMPMALIGARKFKPWILDQYGINGLRVLFVSSISGILVLLAVVYSKIKAKADRTPVLVKTKKPNEPEHVETLTTEDYDLSELKKLLNRTIMGLVIGGVLHFKFNFDDPLLMQALMIPMQIIGAQLVKIHIMGAAPVGDLKRPFVEPNPFAGLLEGGAATPAADNGTEALPADGSSPAEALTEGASTGTTRAKAKAGTTGSGMRERKPLRST